MFWDSDRDYVKMELDTRRYLGRESTARQFFALLSRYGALLPEKWDIDQERTRRVFDPNDLTDVVREWTRPAEMKYLFFHRKRPEVLMGLSIDRFARAKFNSVSMYLRDAYFKDRKRVGEYLQFVADLSSILSVDYGFISHKIQKRRQSAVLTPAERLEGIYWANFFGRAYIEFFGREKLLATPCHEVRLINDDLILLLAAGSPYSAEMLEGDDVVNSIKAYLDQNAFAGPNFPNEPCAVPDFDFSDVRWGTQEPLVESPSERLKRIRSELEMKGYRVVSESSTRLILRGSDGSAVMIDAETGELSVDMTGTLLPPSEP